MSLVQVGLLQVLHFDLVVHSPYRALTGLLQVRVIHTICLMQAVMFTGTQPSQVV